MSICTKIASKKSLNPNYDIIWSFSYDLQGNSGGFVTFLTLPNSDISVGANGSALGIDAGDNSSVRMPGTILALGFDPTGLFGVQSIYNNTGLVSPISNSLNIRTGSTLQFFDAINLPFDIASRQSLRFILTNAAKLLIIEQKNSNDNYNEIFSFNLNLPISPTTNYSVGIGYTSPIISGDPESIFSIQDFHVHGTADTALGSGEIGTDEGENIPQTVSIPPNIFPEYIPPASPIDPVDPPDAQTLAEALSTNGLPDIRPDGTGLMIVNQDVHEYLLREKFLAGEWQLYSPVKDSQYFLDILNTVEGWDLYASEKVGSQIMHPITSQGWTLISDAT